MEPAEWLDRMRTDHQQVLDRIALVAPEPVAAGAHPARPDLAAVRAFTEFLARQFDSHMAAEDRILFGIVADALPATAGSLEPLRQEHHELRAMLRALVGLLDAPASAARDQQIGVQVADLAALLRIHMRKEEHLVFPVVERVLRPGELERLLSNPRSPNEGNSR